MFAEKQPAEKVCVCVCVRQITLTEDSDEALVIKEDPEAEAHDQDSKDLQEGGDIEKSEGILHNSHCCTLSSEKQPIVNLWERKVGKKKASGV